jgi:hypothetical protein
MSGRGISLVVPETGNWNLTFVMLMALPAAFVAALEAMVATVASVSTIKLGMLDPIHSQLNPVKLSPV